MDITKLENSFMDLIAYMKDHGYENWSITRTKSMCLHMIEHKDEYESYLDYFEKFIDSDGYHKVNDRSRHLRSVWRRIWAFDEYDHLPDGTYFNPDGMSHHSIGKLNKTFRTFVYNEVIPALKPDVVSALTVNNLKCIMSRFLLSMQEQGATTLKKITEERILRYFYDGGEQKRGSEIGLLISMMFGRIDNPECIRINSLIPVLRRKEKKLTPFGKDTIALVKEELSKEDSSFSLRDRAIITIALYTGMRGCDISKLKIDNVDWDRDLITIIQSKTQQQLVLPLRAPVGNALFDYLTKEQPDITKDRWLFYKTSATSRQLPQREIGNIIQRFFKKNDFLRNGGKYRIRVFRHHLASTLLNEGTPMQVVRSILGHSTRKAINAYFDVDIEDTRKCGRDISCFPVKEDIFNFQQ